MRYTLPLAALAAALIEPTQAFWRMSCPSRLVRQRADPIVTPGKVSGHVHTIAGGNKFGFSMSFDDARSSECSSCSIKQDFSNYWTPQLFFQAGNGSLTPVPVVGDGADQNGGMIVYYLQRGAADEQLKAFPRDFRMVAGDPFKRIGGNDFPTQAISFACLGANKPETNSFPDYNCPGGLRAQVFFPSCWDGINTDTPDHKSHMSYPIGAYNSGRCPPTHPVHLISIFYEILYDTNAFASSWTNGKQPFVLANGDSTGFGFHGDFLNGWDIDVLQAAVTDCTSDTGLVERCQHFTQFTGAESRACRLPEQVDEQTSGWLSALPGCNPITGAGPRAVPVSNCDAPNTIVPGSTNFVDLTVSKGWEYTGCGTDDYFSRTFDDASTASDSMTVETCVDFCASKNLPYAGLEYSKECYCGAALSQARAPKQGVMGSCQMKCAGDEGEFCGGASALSIYHRCEGGECQNVQFGVNGNVTARAVEVVERREVTEVVPAHLHALRHLHKRHYENLQVL